MILKLKKIIITYLILFLLIGRIGFLPVYADEAAPTRPPEPTREASQGSNGNTREEKPTEAPKPTNPPGGSDSSSPTKPPLPTSPPPSSVTPVGVSPTVSNTNPSPTGGSSASASDNISGNSESSGSTASSTKDANPSVNDPYNIATGPGSTNNASETFENKMEKLNNDLAVMQNKIDAIASTGYNYANFNTLDGQVTTGNAFNTYNLLNKLNSNISGVGGFSVFNIYDKYSGDIVFNMPDGVTDESFASASGAIAKNALTGPLSDNSADGQSDFVVKEANGNDASLTNDINLQAVSGGNSASFNTGGGSIKTGSAGALANVVNLVNTNLNVSQWLFGVVNVFGQLTGNIVLPQDPENTNTANSSGTAVVQNSQTGPLSDNNSSSSTSTSSEYTNNNTAVIADNLNVSANTGDNQSSANTGGGSIKTGNSDVSVKDTTVANTNTVNEDGTVWMVIVNEMGKWVGHIIGAPWGSSTASNSLPVGVSQGGGQNSSATQSENIATGPLSDNNSSLSSNNETTLENNNNATVTNNLNITADSGNNTSSYNTGSGDVETGNAKAGANLLNMVNTNVTAKKFVVVLVNVLGEFLGNIITPGNKTAEYSDSFSGLEDRLGDNSTNNNGIANSPTPTPTVYAPSSTSGSGGVGGTDASFNPTPTPSYNNANQDNNSGSVQYQNYPTYTSQVSQTSMNVRRKTTYLAGGQTYNPTQMGTQSTVEFKRGIYLSPNFVKATETSIAGMLFGGAHINVNQTWLSVIPFTILAIFLRRRRKINISKYLNSLLEVVL